MLRQGMVHWEWECNIQTFAGCALGPILTSMHEHTHGRLTTLLYTELHASETLLKNCAWPKPILLHKYAWVLLLMLWDGSCHQLAKHQEHVHHEEVRQQAHPRQRLPLQMQIRQVPSARTSW
jgi:hypothetical protein